MTRLFKVQSVQFLLVHVTHGQIIQPYLIHRWSKPCLNPLPGKFPAGSTEEAGMTNRSLIKASTWLLNSFQDTHLLPFGCFLSWGEVCAGTPHSPIRSSVIPEHSVPKEMLKNTGLSSMMLFLQGLSALTHSGWGLTTWGANSPPGGPERFFNKMGATKAACFSSCSVDHSGNSLLDSSCSFLKTTAVMYPCYHRSLRVKG